ncbi:hypothetical protein [Paenibacillus sp. NPDC057934]
MAKAFVKEGAKVVIVGLQRRGRQSSH